jgi:hypothetical protein
MTTDELIAAVEASIAQYWAELAPPPPPPALPTITPEQFASALTDPALPAFQLVATGIYAAAVIQRPLTIHGNGARLQTSTSAPALDIRPGTHNVIVRDVVCASSGDSAVRVGANSDMLAAQVPKGIVLDRVRIPTHRGKRAFEIHGEVDLLTCEALDCFYPAAYGTGGTDSQGLWIHNTTGNVRVYGGRYQAGSECMMTGGDTYRVTDWEAPTNLLFEDVLFDRPIAWKGATDYNRQVKNTCELKNGVNATFRRCTLRNCWKEAQDGYGFMFTATRGGRVRNVVLEDCVVECHASAINIVGSDSWGLNAVRSTLRVVGGRFTVDKLTYGGVGRFLLATAGPSSQGSLQVESIDVEGALIQGDGTSVIYVDGVGGSSTTSVGPQKIDRLRVTGSDLFAGQYGFSIEGNHNGANSQAGVTLLDVAGNTIRGAATALRTNLPNNTFV